MCCCILRALASVTSQKVFCQVTRSFCLISLNVPGWNPTPPTKDSEFWKSHGSEAWPLHSHHVQPVGLAHCRHCKSSPRWGLTTGRMDAFISAKELFQQQLNAIAIILYCKVLCYCASGRERQLLLQCIFAQHIWWRAVHITVCQHSRLPT